MKIGAAILFLATTSMLAQQPYYPEIPKTWDASGLAALEVPHPDPRYSPVAVPVEYYYRVPSVQFTKRILYTLRAESQHITSTG